MVKQKQKLWVQFLTKMLHLKLEVPGALLGLQHQLCFSVFTSKMGKAFKNYYNKHSNESLQSEKKSLTDATQENKIRKSLIEKCLAVPAPPPAPAPVPVTPPPTPKEEEDENRVKTDEELVEMVTRQMLQHQKESQDYYFKWLETLPSTWEKRILDLEFRRKQFNQKRGWSADDQYEVEQIDADIDYCKRKLDALLIEMEEFWTDSEDDCNSDC